MGWYRPHRHCGNGLTVDVNNPEDKRPGLLFRHRTLWVVSAHGALFALALLASFCLAYNFRLVGLWGIPLYLPLLALALPTKLLVFYWLGQYHGSWRYVGLRDLFGVISASLVASFVFLLSYFALENIFQYVADAPLIDRAIYDDEIGAGVRTVTLRQSSVFALDWAGTIAFVAAARILVRFYYEDIQPGTVGDSGRALIVGAGDEGEALLREVLRMRRLRFTVVGFLDDEVRELHGRIHGVEILGRTDQIRDICVQHEVQNVLIAMRQAGPKVIGSLVERCEGLGVTFKTIPAVKDVIQGRVEVSQIRNVDIADLLGRDPIELDTDKIGQQLRGRRVVVTGAGGSIGSEMCRQIASFGPRQLALLEQAENNLFEIERELRLAHPDLAIVPYVADITDRQRVERIFGFEEPSVVFHAAAHKHVPMMELNPGEAIKNNVMGSRVIADTAASHGVQTMVMISTDKAVNPTSVMGCTKRVAEMYVQCLNERVQTQYLTVRFGNVLGSSGSVVPIFQKQIAAGGPVTVTDPEMVRFFMTIPEASQLVLQAGTMGKGGEIYVLHMGAPVKIVDLARAMIKLSGFRPDVDIEITYTGRRPGEKLYEELSHEGEDIGDTAHAKIGIWRHRSEDFDAVVAGIDRLFAVADDATPEQLQAELAAMVPEYQPEAERSVTT